MKRKFAFIISLLTLSLATSAQVFDWKIIETGKETSFRALSVVNDSVAWVGGSNGWVGRTLNGGKSWNFTQVPGFEKLDFRSLYAHDARQVVIANAGYPANIAITNDGGRNWYTVFTLRDSAAFIDGVDFWDREEGIIYGDPINGKMFLMSTNDGGIIWTPFKDENRPALNDGEASFAASGTTIRCAGRHTVVIGTGGKTSRIWQSEDKGNTWKSIPVPILHGESSQGIFSVALGSKKDMVVVGGDYLRDSVSVDHVFHSDDGGATWKKPSSPTRGYRECVEYIDSSALIAIGPTGAEVSFDNGAYWRKESDEKYFHVVEKARDGKLIIAAGGKGRIAIIKRK